MVFVSAALVRLGLTEMRRALWQRRRAALLLAVAFLAAGFGVLAHSNHLLHRPEQQTVDVRFQIRGTERSKTAGVALVYIDDATFNYLRNRNLHARWPFPRRYDARVIDRLQRAGAKVIAFDVQFTEPSDRVDDNALIEAIGRARKVVLSTTEVGPHGGTSVLGGNEVLRRLGARAGNTSKIPDSDGVLRNTQYSINGLKSFGVVVAEADTGRAVPPSLFGGASNPVPIDYAGPPGTFPSVSYSRVYSGRFPPGFFAGKIVIVGASAPTLQDLHQTPLSGSSPMAGPEVLANDVATVLAGIPLSNAPSWVTVLLIVLLALVVPLAGMRLGTLGVVLVALGTLALWSLAAQIAFDSGTVLDYSDPAAALLLATLGTVVVGLRADSRERKRLRNLFAADSTAVVEEVLHSTGPRPLEPTAIIAGYRIEEAIGHGGMGVVYRATQQALERTVAIKLIATERAQDPVFRTRFKLESRLAASIEHVNVIPVYEAGEDDGLLFIAMRLVEGTDLAQLLERGGALEATRTARLFGQLAGALDAAHARGLAHRDVKPANVLVTLDRPEHVYLTDFGVAKHVGAGEGVTTAGQWVGTLDYLAPEQIRGEEAGTSVDVYALAGLLHHCLTGEVPFPRDNEAAKLWAQVNAPPPAPSRLVPGLPPAIDDVVARGMAKDPATRFQTATELARACARALGVAVEDPRPSGSAAGGGPYRPQGGSAPTVISE
ncbi:MAG TPA: CHASE2 domain-containing protein [Solirubrobacterales bacterium]|nr:CHASE2 domain-containing protein [Solirubrobacterales bacterium]